MTTPSGDRPDSPNLFTVFALIENAQPIYLGDPAVAFVVATALADTHGAAIISNNVLGRAYRLTAADESEEATAEVMSDPEAMARIEEAEEELAQRWLETGGREPTAEERAHDRRVLLERARERAKSGEFIEYTEEDLRELREGGD